ncbi:MarR family transcriptional regulator [Streptomyces sp. NPDC052309]|uniref:MarR family winged helix-turn-helix transcriptional regulator n=1 Tax=Streptomyces sp. NPDC052309 TaxID=3155421 RepID=UPI003446D748
MREDAGTWHLFLRAHDALIKRFENELKTDCGLSISQFDALAHLSRAPQGQLRMAELAGAVLYSSGAATKVLDKLTAAGLVERTRDHHDRRVVVVKLTSRGREVFTRASRLHGRSIERDFTAFLSEEERPHVVDFLERLTNHLNAAQDG